MSEVLINFTKTAGIRKVHRDLDAGQGNTTYESFLPRVVMSKKHLKLETILRAGYERSLISIPEPGQVTFLSWRHPKGYHAHDHGTHWVFHKDQHSVVGSKIKDIFKHIKEEGKPGFDHYRKYLKEDGRPLLKLFQIK